MAFLLLMCLVSYISGLEYMFTPEMPGPGKLVLRNISEVTFRMWGSGSAGYGGGGAFVHASFEIPECHDSTLLIEYELGSGASGSLVTDMNASCPVQPSGCYNPFVINCTCCYG